MRVYSEMLINIMPIGLPKLSGQTAETTQKLMSDDNAVRLVIMQAWKWALIWNPVNRSDRFVVDKKIVVFLSLYVVKKLVGFSYRSDRAVTRSDRNITSPISFG